MPTPLEILLDPVSLVVVATYAGRRLDAAISGRRRAMHGVGPLRRVAGMLPFKDINKNRPEPPRRLTAGRGAF